MTLLLASPCCLAATGGCGAMLRLAATAVIGSLAVGSGRNLLQTWRFQHALLLSSSSSSLSSSPQDRYQLLMRRGLMTGKNDSSNNRCSAIVVPPYDEKDNNDPTTKQIVGALQRCTRRELLELFAVSEAPASLTEIQGAWNGCLLDNNGFFMSSVTRFLTHGLFGRGRRWNGKAFYDAPSTTNSDTSVPAEKKRGINRFFDSKQQQQQQQQPSHRNQPTAVHHQHSFDYSLRPSRATRDGKPCVRLEYRNYQSRLSLWYSMNDELRIVPVTILGQGSRRRRRPQVIIGLGSMTWSGGVLNASPFCLWREEQQPQPQ